MRNSNTTTTITPAARLPPPTLYITTSKLSPFTIPLPPDPLKQPWNTHLPPGHPKHTENFQTPGITPNL
ncbi:hypothetical protein E2C01_081307 [Portunus trituberculatus]|uniref:Uncharacterized protein n=1 Tax=Portunus trituberculatus TaxID=210409 RepID=A0A5B7IYF9_PORTR|nr:hypothetical protein [Portunus trituberculatus]